MANILHIISSPRNDYSYSTKLGISVVEKLLAEDPSSEVITKNLYQAPIPHLEQKHINAFYSNPETRTEAQSNDAIHSDTSIAELKWADTIVLSVGVYNFGIPSSLKAWIDQVVRSGKTFKVTETGAVGLLENKKVYLAVTSKGVYSEGPMKQFDFVVPYLTFVLQFIGIHDIQVVRIEGTSVADEQEALLQKVRRELVPELA